MKKYLLLSAFITFTVAASFAEQLTPQQALERLNPKGSRAQISEMKLVYTASEGDINQFYIFNGASDGFTIVAADDCISPLIGYADSGSFDPANMPDNMKAWLKSYQRQIDAAILSGETQSRTTVSRATIAPLVTTQWYQSSPYNNNCPMDGDSRSVTGCVATAMAQVMKYHNWPSKGNGSNSYSWTNSAGTTTTLSMDFSSITFDWNNMLNVYDSASTDAQNAAVAQLMAACGYGVNMNYSSSGSGAVSPRIAYALTQYFNYDGGVQYILRDYYGIEEWENMIYTELAAGRPVIYDGVTSSEAGHEFVCDGYDNGYYHINWGWGGMSDGYFKLTLLTPSSQGIGGSNSGYNYNQGATIGIQKNTSGSTASAPAPYIVAESFTIDDAIFNATGSQSYKKFSVIYFGDSFMNMSVTSILMNFGLKFTNTSTGKIQYAKCAYSDTQLQDMPFSLGGITSFSVYASSMPDTGTWTITPAYYNLTTLTWNDILVPISTPIYKAVCTSSTVTISKESSASITATDLQLLTPLYANSKYKISATLSVEGSEYYGAITALLYKSGASYSAASDTLDIVDILPGEQLEYEGIGDFKNFASKITAATECQLALADYAGNLISDKISVTVYPTPDATTFTVTDIKFPTATAVVNNIPQMPCNEITIEATVSCTEGYLSDPVRVYMFPCTSGTVYSVASFTSETLFIPAGSSQQITVTGSYGSPGNYFLSFYIDSSTWSDQKSFDLTDAVTGIVTPNADETEITVSPNPASDFINVTAPNTMSLIEIYSLNGTRMTSVAPNDIEASIDAASYPAGHYLVRIITADGSATKRLIKK